MTKQTRDLLPIPESKIVGRGIYIRPRQPYELKEKLIKLSDSKSYYAKETDQTYSIPGGYEVNDSPPLPANQMLNQTVYAKN